MNIHQLKPQAASFDVFYDLYPHNPGRKGKAKARELFRKITSPGGVRTRSINKDSGGYDELHLEATPEEIIEGVRRYRQTLPKVNPNSYTLDTTYVPAAYVWLNQGRWED